MSGSLLAAATGAAIGLDEFFQPGVSKRRPRTRLTATKKYTAPKIGHQRRPAFSIQAKRASHCWLENAGR